MRAKKISYWLTAGTAVVVALFGCSCVAVQVVHTPKPEKEYWFDQIQFEIAAITSVTPSAEALSELQERLHENQICRRNNISFSVHARNYPPPPNNVFSSELLNSFETVLRRDRDLDPNDRRLKVFIAYVSGVWVKDEEMRFISGLTYTDSSFAIFKNFAKSHESTVLLHEFGHLLSVVREYYENHDDDHPHHCVNENCTMYWTAPEVGDDYCPECKAEILRQIRHRKKLNIGRN